MIYEMIDGQEYTGKTAAEVVSQMAEDKMATPRSLESYRQATARRTAAVYGADIDPSTDETFLQTMCDSGLMRKIN
jgi:hypothetical protein